jgi:hypothetical protein
VAKCLVRFLPAVVWKTESILKNQNYRENIIRQWFLFLFLGSRCFNCEWQAKNLYKLKKELFNFQIEYKGNISNPRITGEEIKLSVIPKLPVHKIYSK